MYGTLVYHNDEDTVRDYFITEPELWFFKRWMFAQGWDYVSATYVQTSKVLGLNVKVKNYEGRNNVCN